MPSQLASIPTGQRWDGTGSKGVGERKVNTLVAMFVEEKGNRNIREGGIERGRRGGNSSERSRSAAYPHFTLQRSCEIVLDECAEE
jgi:hypothetical protein